MVNMEDAQSAYKGNRMNSKRVQSYVITYDDNEIITRCFCYEHFISFMEDEGDFIISSEIDNLQCNECIKCAEDDK